jgi:hypothetical protein
MKKLHIAIVTRGTVRIDWAINLFHLKEELEDYFLEVNLIFAEPGADLVRGRNDIARLVTDIASENAEDNYVLFLDDDIFPSLKDVIQARELLACNSANMVAGDYFRRDGKGTCKKTGKDLGIREKEWLFFGMGFVMIISSNIINHFADEREKVYLADDFSMFYDWQERGYQVLEMPWLIEHRPV